MIIHTTKRDYMWSYVAYVLKFGSNLIIFPIVLNMLTTSEYGIWITFSSMGILINLFDFGFSSTILRNLTYVWGGANSLQANGYRITNDTTQRNDRLFVLTYCTCKKLYSGIAILAMLISYTIGLGYMIYIIKDNFCSNYIIAWLIYGTSLGINLYYAYCTVTLKAVGAISESQKATICGFSIQIIISYIGLMIGGGVVALSLASCLCGFMTRLVSKYYFTNYCDIREIIEKYRPSITITEIFNSFKILWYNAQRAGISSISTVLMIQSTTLLCSTYFGVAITGEYGLCLQIISAISNIAMIQYQTVLPQLTQARLTNNKDLCISIFSNSIVFSWIVYLLGCIIVLLINQPLLYLIKSQTMLNKTIFIIMGLYMFGEMNYSLHASYISLENKLPFVKSVVITSTVVVVLSWIIVALNVSIIGLMLTRLIVESVYIFWKWPVVARQQLSVSWYGLLFTGLRQWRFVLADFLQIVNSKIR